MPFNAVTGCLVAVSLLVAQVVKSCWRVPILGVLCATSLTQGPEILLQGGQASIIQCVAADAEGRMLVSADNSRVCVWDVRRARMVRRFQVAGQLLPHESPTTLVYAVAIDGNCEWVAAACSDRVRMWNLSTGRIGPAIESRGGSTALAFHGDGRLAVPVGIDVTWDSPEGAGFGSGDAIALIDVATGKRQTTLRHYTVMSATDVDRPAPSRLFPAAEPVAAQPPFRMPVHLRFLDNHALLSVESDGFTIWDLETAAVVRRVSFTPRQHLLAAVSADGTRLAISGERASAWPADGVVVIRPDEVHPIEVLDVAKGTVVATIDQGSNAKAMAFAPVGHILAVTTSQSLRLFDADNGRQRAELAKTGSDVLAWVQHGRALARHEPRGPASLDMVDAATGEVVLALASRNLSPVACCWSRSGRSLGIVGGLSKSVLVIDFDGDELFVGKRGLGTLEGSGLVRLLAASSDDNRFLVTNEQMDGFAVADLRSGESKSVPVPGAGYVEPACFDRGGTKCAAILGVKQNGFAVCDLSRREVLRQQLPTEEGPRIDALLLDPLGSRLLIHRRDGVSMLDLESGKESRAHGGTPAAFRQDGSVVATSGSARLFLSRSDGGERLAEISLGDDLDPALWPRCLTFTPDGHELLVGLGTGCVVAVDARNGAVLRRTLPEESHAGAVAALAIDPPGRLLATAGADGTTRLWRFPDLQLVATIAVVGEDDAVMILPSGHYAASSGAAEAISFRLGGEVFDLEQFDCVWNRPAEVLASVGLTSPARLAAFEAVSRLREARDRPLPGAVAGRAPALQVTADPTGPGTDRDRVQLTIAATPPAGERIAAVSLSVNGVPQTLPPVVAGELAGAVRLEATMPLTPGSNRIRILATSDGGLASPQEVLELTRTGGSRDRCLYVVAIGLSKHVDRGFDLAFAAKDARDLAALFVNPALRAFDSAFAQVKTLVIVDEQVTRAGLHRVSEFLAAGRLQDTVLITWSGHGQRDASGVFYLATHDMVFAAPAEKGVEYATVESWLAQAPMRERILMLDTCQAGEDFAATVPVPAPPADVSLRVQRFPDQRGIRPEDGTRPDATILLQAMFQDLRRSCGAHVIAATAAQSYAVESARWKNGAFTHAVLEGVATLAADQDRDGVLTLDELRRYVSRQVERWTGGRQRPNLRASNRDSVPILMRVHRDHWDVQRLIRSMDENGK